MATRTSTPARSGRASCSRPSGPPGPGGTMHGLRHAHASWLLTGGVDLQVVKERLGHAKIPATEGYRHTLPDAGQTALAAPAPRRHSRDPRSRLPDRCPAVRPPMLRRPGRQTACYRHRYPAISRQRSWSMDRQCSISVTVTRTGRCPICRAGTRPASTPQTLRN